MTKPIVAGIDPLAPDRSPLLAAAALARLTGAPVVAVAAYVHDSISNAVSAGQLDAELRESAAAALEAAAEGIAAERVVAGGFSASHALHDVAMERDAGLVVVGSSRKGRFGRVAPGTTAERLLHGAAWPVLVTPAGLDPEWRPARIGVGYVAVEEAEHALAAADALARLAGAPLEAVTAVAPRAQSAAVPPYGADGMAAMRESASTALDRALAAVGREAGEGAVFAGEAVDGLVALSERSDLVVCGSRGYGPIRSVLLGGVGHGLLRDAACPVLVVPRGAGDAIAALGSAGAAATA